ncbi:hypothetical protein T484DRAFT_1795397, partial [Baffinella frigidus]
AQEEWLAACAKPSALEFVASRAASRADASKGVTADAIIALCRGEIPGAIGGGDSSGTTASGTNVSGTTASGTNASGAARADGSKSVTADVLLGLYRGGGGSAKPSRLDGSKGVSTDALVGLIRESREEDGTAVPHFFQAARSLAQPTTSPPGGANDVPGEDEIIELPVILLDGVTGIERARFHRFIRPTSWDSLLKGLPKDSPKLNKGARTVSFAKAVQHLEEWMTKEGVNVADTSGYLFVTCGNWDIGTIIPKQCKKSKIALPAFWGSFSNIKTVFNLQYNKKASGMKDMLRSLRMPLKGVHHLGMDDTANLAGIVRKMLSDGGSFEATDPVGE